MRYLNLGEKKENRDNGVPYIAPIECYINGRTCSTYIVEMYDGNKKGEVLYYFANKEGNISPIFCETVPTGKEFNCIPAFRGNGYIIAQGNTLHHGNGIWAIATEKKDNSEFAKPLFTGEFLGVEYFSYKICAVKCKSRSHVNTAIYSLVEAKKISNDFDCLFPDISNDPSYPKVKGTLFIKSFASFDGFRVIAGMVDHETGVVSPIGIDFNTFEVIDLPLTEDGLIDEEKFERLPISTDYKWANPGEINYIDPNDYYRAILNQASLVGLIRMSSYEEVAEGRIRITIDNYLHKIKELEKQEKESIRVIGTDPKFGSPK